MYSKNEKIELDILDMGVGGEGIAKKDAFVFFVKNAVIDDKVLAVITKVSKNSNIIFAKTIDVIKESKYRVKPLCDRALSCGGCQMMSLSYDKQLVIKENIVKNNLKRIGGLSDKVIDDRYEGIIGMENPYHFRNKIQVPFTIKDDKVISGFYAERTHYIIENENCAVEFIGASDIVKTVREYLNAEYMSKNNKITIYDEKSGDGIFRELMIRKANNEDNISVTFIVNDKKLNGNNDKKEILKYDELKNLLIEKFKCIKTITINVNVDNNNVLFGKKNIVIYGDGFINDILCNLKFNISSNSFYQINNVQTERLYNTVLNFIKDKKIKNAIDLYCGIGTITLLLSKVCENILGIEIVDAAVKNANENAKINGIKNAEFVCSDADKDLENSVKSFIISNKNIDLISVDPPRKGLDTNTIDFIKKISPKYVLYVSCDSATLSRDIKMLSDLYEVLHIKLVDMFPHTMHVETVALLGLKD